MSDATQTASLADIAARFSKVQTAMLSDALDELGELKCTLPAEIRPVADDMRLAGPAWTVTGRRSAVPLDRMVTLRQALKILGSVPADHVCIFEANDEDGFSAHIGEFHATCMVTNGAAGSVTSGGSRDTKELRALGYPVFSHYKTPQDSLPRWEMLDTGRSIKIGDVAIAPGDYVVADIDGVVVIPAHLRDKVLEMAETAAAEEVGILDEVKKGVPPLDAFLAAIGETS
jgi:4-hydroxy-4-methyl-2-oxoglutarate aldolase